MTHNHQFLPADQLDFSAVRANFKTYMEQNPKFKDVDFDGSNVSVLLDLLSYNTMLNGYYLNQIGSEMFLDSALLRESIVSHAKELNYVPLSAAGAKAIIDITIEPGDSPSSITIPKNYAFNTVIDNKNLHFIVPQNIVITDSGSGYVVEDVEIHEGRVVEERFDITATENPDGSGGYTEMFVMESENIDTASLEVLLYSDINDTAPITLTRAENLFGLSSASYIYFLRGNSANKYQLEFGNGVLGVHLTTGNIIKVTYRDVVGSEGNGTNTFIKTESIEGYGSITAVTTTVAYGGTEREADENIRYNAVRHFQTQDRGVIASDFVTLVKNKFPEVQSVIAYGGEEVQQYGKVMISIKPYGSLGVATTSLKNQIVAYLKLKSMTTEPIVVDPEYFYVGIVSKVYYNLQQLTTNATSAKAAVVAALELYDTNNLDDFDKDLFYSHIIAAAIDDTNVAIKSNDTDVSMIYRWTPTVDVDHTVNYSYSNTLKSSSDTLFEYPVGHQPVVYSSSFTYRVDPLIATDTTAFIRDDGLGMLHLYLYTETSGEITKLVSNIGTVDYSTGEITFKLSVRDYTSYISIYATLSNKDIIVKQNQFLLIDGSDISVEMIESND